MIFYQLWASGGNCLDTGTMRICSKKIFANVQDAKDYIPTFIKSCETPINEFDLRYIEKVTNNGILELECDEIFYCELYNNEI